MQQQKKKKKKKKIKIKKVGKYIGAFDNNSLELSNVYYTDNIKK